MTILFVNTSPHHNAHAVNQNLIIPTIVAPFWCQLVLIIVISRLRDLKHRHLAGAFFWHQF